MEPWHNLVDFDAPTALMMEVASHCDNNIVNVRHGLAWAGGKRNARQTDERIIGER